MPTDVVFKRELRPLRTLLWHWLRLKFMIISIRARPIYRLRRMYVRALVAAAYVLVKEAERAASL